MYCSRTTAYPSRRFLSSVPEITDQENPRWVDIYSPSDSGTLCHYTTAAVHMYGQMNHQWCILLDFTTSTSSPPKFIRNFSLLSHVTSLHTVHSVRPCWPAAASSSSTINISCTCQSFFPRILAIQITFAGEHFFRILFTPITHRSGAQDDLPTLHW